MGNLCKGSSREKKSRNDSLIKIKSHNDSCYYKPRINSSSLLCLDPEKKTSHEEALDTKIIFKEGCMFAKLGPGLYIVIGGRDTSEAFIIHLMDKKVTNLPPAPYSMSFGQLNKYKDRVYITGALLSDGSQKTPAPPLYFDLKCKRWVELPPMPQQIALSGSYIVHTFLYLIGGFLNYTENPYFFDSLIIFDIPAECWVQSEIKTPIRGSLPNCTVLPSSAILIIGGYDPNDSVAFDNNKVLLFDGKDFESCSDIPAEGNLKFLNDGLNLRTEIYLFSDDDILFIYNIESDVWSIKRF